MKSDAIWMVAVAVVAALLGAGAYLALEEGDRSETTPVERTLATAPASSARRPTNEARGTAARPFAFTAPAADADDIADVRFVDGDGRRMSLAHFQGREILLNLWATWCGPCREEMPTLDRLQSRLGSTDFEVVALSIDTGGLDVVRDFYDELGLEALQIYVDPSGSAAVNLNVLGLPSTILLDREGREVGRYVGPAEWDSEIVVEAIQALRRRSDTTRETTAANIDSTGTQ